MQGSLIKKQGGLRAPRHALECSEGLPCRGHCIGGNRRVGVVDRLLARLDHSRQGLLQMALPRAELFLVLYQLAQILEADAFDPVSRSIRYLRMSTRT